MAPIATERVTLLIFFKEFSKKNHDNLLDDLKLMIQSEASKHHKWDTKALDSLVNLILLIKIDTLKVK